MNQFSTNQWICMSPICNLSRIVSNVEQLLQHSQQGHELIQFEKFHKAIETYFNDINFTRIANMAQYEQVIEMMNEYIAKLQQNLNFFQQQYKKLFDIAFEEIYPKKFILDTTQLILLKKQQGIKSQDLDRYVNLYLHNFQYTNAQGEQLQKLMQRIETYIYTQEYDFLTPFNRSLKEIPSVPLYQYQVQDVKQHQRQEENDYKIEQNLKQDISQDFKLEQQNDEQNQNEMEVKLEKLIFMSDRQVKKIRSRAKKERNNSLKLRIDDERSLHNYNYNQNTGILSANQGRTYIIFKNLHQRKIYTHKFNLCPRNNDNEFTVCYGLVDLNIMQIDDYNGMMIMNQNGQFVTHQNHSYPIEGMSLIQEQQPQPQSIQVKNDKRQIEFMVGDNVHIVKLTKGKKSEPFFILILNNVEVELV